MLKMLKGVKEVTAEDLEEVVHAVGHVQDQEIVDGGIGVVQESGKIYSVISPRSHHFNNSITCRTCYLNSMTPAQ